MKSTVLPGLDGPNAALLARLIAAQKVKCHGKCSCRKAPVRDLASYPRLQLLDKRTHVVKLGCASQLSRAIRSHGGSWAGSSHLGINIVKPSYAILLQDEGDEEGCSKVWTGVLKASNQSRLNIDAQVHARVLARAGAVVAVIAPMHALVHLCVHALVHQVKVGSRSATDRIARSDIWNACNVTNPQSNHKAAEGFFSADGCHSASEAEKIYESEMKKRQPAYVETLSGSGLCGDAHAVAQVRWIVYDTWAKTFHVDLQSGLAPRLQHVHKRGQRLAFWAYDAEYDCNVVFCSAGNLYLSGFTHDFEKVPHYAGDAECLFTEEELLGGCTATNRTEQIEVRFPVGTVSKPDKLERLYKEYTSALFDLVEGEMKDVGPVQPLTTDQMSSCVRKGGRGGGGCMTGRKVNKLSKTEEGRKLLSMPKCGLTCETSSGLTEIPERSLRVLKDWGFFAPGNPDAVWGIDVSYHALCDTPLLRDMGLAHDSSEEARQRQKISANTVTAIVKKMQTNEKCATLVVGVEDTQQTLFQKNVFRPASTLEVEGMLSKSNGAFLVKIDKRNFKAVKDELTIRLVKDITDCDGVVAPATLSVAGVCWCVCVRVCWCVCVCACEWVPTPGMCVSRLSPDA